MGAAAWIITGGILMTAGAGLFAVTQIYTGRWLRDYLRRHE